MYNRYRNFELLDYRVWIPVFPLLVLLGLTYLFGPDLLRDGVRTFKEIKSMLFRIVIWEVVIYTIGAYVIYRIRKNRPIKGLKE